jgi:hypothetical protein
MHKEVIQFVRGVKQMYPNHFKQKNGRRIQVLEVGSLDVNGSVRKYFDVRKEDYIGIDVNEGKGVDKVIRIHEYKLPYSFTTIISTEMLEHDKYWEDSLIQMFHNLRMQGLLVLTCAAPNRKEHGTIGTTPQDSPFTTDYYRNISIADFSRVLPPKLFNPYYIEVIRDGKDLVFYGIKADNNAALNRKVPEFNERSYKSKRSDY